MEDYNFKHDQEDIDQRYLTAACENTYLILTGKATYEALLEKESMQNGSIDQHIATAILFNPFEDTYKPKFPHLHNETSRAELVDTMIEYYVETEEYEKCQDLVNYKDTLC